MNKAPTIFVTSREAITQQQLTLLLHTAQTLTHCLNGGGPRSIFDPEGSLQKEGTSMDGGVKSALESTVIRALGCMDDIIGDKTRWSVEAHNEMEKRLQEMMVEQTNLAKAQEKLALMQLAPHSRYKPSLIKHVALGWVAFLGSMQDLDNSIFGTGPSPAAALADFDSQFNGEMPERLAQWLRAVEASLEKGEEPPTLTQHEQQQQQVDTNGNQKTDGTEVSGENQGGNCEGAGPDSDSSGAQTGPDGNPSPGGPS